MSTTTPASSRPSGRPRSRRRRATTLVAAVTLLVGAGAACEPVPPDTTPPRWAEVNVLMGFDVTALGPHLGIRWPGLADAARYRIDANGVTATVQSGTATACVLVGLSAATTYDIEVTAYDAAGNWSGSLPNLTAQPSRLTAERTTPSGPGGGPALRCVAATDADGDRLPDALETNTGTYAHTAAAGTSPTVPDTDLDGLTDGDEVLGTSQGLDLYGLGTRPMRPDLLVEVDWLSGYPPRSGCVAPSAPHTSWWAGAIAGFAQTHPDTPGGGAGINLIVDSGQGGLLTGGNAIPHPTGDIGSPSGGLESVGDPHLAANRRGYFHHALFIGRWWGGSWQSRPLAQRNGSRLWIPSSCTSAQDPWAASADLTHELGHNLGLLHGGDEHANQKPSYNSVMNYRYYTGLDRNCDDWTDDGANRRLGFSDGSRPDLDESHVVEAHGVCGNVPVDFNGNGTIDAAPYGLNLDSETALSVLHDHDDLAAMDLTAFNDDSRAAHRELIAETGP